MKKKILIFVVFTFVFLLGGTFIVRTGFVKGIALDASYPFLNSVSKISDFLDYIFELFTSKDQLIKKNTELEKKVELLKAQIIYLKRLEKENLELKKIVNFIKNYPEYSFKTGKVIGYSPDNWNNFIIINLGKNDGLKVGDIVVSDGYLLGEVYQTGFNSSSVILISDKNFRISVRCRKTRETVFYQGKNQKEGKLIYVKPEQDIRIGDVIETSGVDSGIPEGIPIGTVKSVSYEEGDFYKDVSVSINVNPMKIEYVVVISRKEGKK
ncbi:rod shape-determining protein MreC [Persephonella hydrogeniphila]|uniref:Cell shape-determining protein MreC n=1 Tax=Persephonella hydrogeniphila TaxID=198703 RepID=A0A285NGW9_9AQUI|nr:rod shape-determining protein MreC [Persephonella hydrogeniphila]SNZ07136.1 rod shape-determining protein MreC [Persephonella hydrogeniphila]